MANEKEVVQFTGTIGDIDLANISTKYPVIEPGLVDLTIQGFEIKSKEKDGKKQESLAVTFVTANAYAEYQKPDVMIPAGHKITSNILLTPTGGWTEDSKLKALARLKEAALGHHDGVFNAGELVGKSVAVQLAVRSSADYDDSNEIKKYLPKEV